MPIIAYKELYVCTDNSCPLHTIQFVTIDPLTVPVGRLADVPAHRTIPPIGVILGISR